MTRPCVIPAEAGNQKALDSRFCGNDRRLSFLDIWYSKLGIIYSAISFSIDLSSSASETGALG